MDASRSDRTRFAASAFLALVRRMAACALGLAAVVAVQLVSSAAIEARQLNDAEKVALAETVKRFDAIMREKRYGETVSVVPPLVLATIARKAGATVEQLQKAMAEQLAAISGSVKIESFAMELARVQYRELPGGRPYAVVPTRTVIDLGDGHRMVTSTETVGVLDDGKWYLVRVEDQGQIAMLREAYPEFSKVEFAMGTRERVKK